STALFLVTAIWVMTTSAANDPKSTEAASANSPTLPGPSMSSGLLEKTASCHLGIPITAADLPVIARLLANRYQSGPNESTASANLKPCLLAAIDQRATPLAFTIFPYQHEQAGNVLSAIVVFRSPRARNQLDVYLDVYVVQEGCTDEKGRLLDTQK